MLKLHFLKPQQNNTIYILSRLAYNVNTPLTSPLQKDIFFCTKSVYTLIFHLVDSITDATAKVMFLL